MKTLAENANAFSSIRTMDKVNCIYVDKADCFRQLVDAKAVSISVGPLVS